MDAKVDPREASRSRRDCGVSALTELEATSEQRIEIWFLLVPEAGARTRRIDYS
jgi:hypothetical protein